MWRSKAAIRPWRPPSALNATYPPTPHYAPGSCRRSNVIDIRGLGGPFSFDPQVDASCDIPHPALCPEHASASTTSPRPGPFPPHPPPPLLAALFGCFIGSMDPSDSSPLPRRLRLLDFPSRPVTAGAAAGEVRSPRFRRVPFLRDVASDPGRATGPRIAAPHILPSTDTNASAPATLILSWLNPTPRKIAMYAPSWSSPSTTQHSLPGGRYPLPGPDFHRLDRVSLLAHRIKIIACLCCVVIDRIGGIEGAGCCVLAINS